MLSRNATRAASTALALGFLSLSVGCGSNYQDRATVKGQVTFAGRPLNYGTVMFWGDDNVTASARIDLTGNYVMNDAPLGDVKIIVIVPKLPPMGVGPTPPGMKTPPPVISDDPNKKGPPPATIPKQIVAIPEKYAKPETSGLTYTVKKGEQTHNITLTP